MTEGIQLAVGKSYRNAAGERINIVAVSPCGNFFYDQHHCHYLSNGYWCSARQDKADLVREIKLLSIDTIRQFLKKRKAYVPENSLG